MNLSDNETTIKQLDVQKDEGLKIMHMIYLEHKKLNYIKQSKRSDLIFKVFRIETHFFFFFLTSFFLIKCIF